METELIEGTVLEVLAGTGLAHVRGDDGSIYGLTRQTLGIEFDEVREGHRVRLEVQAKFSRVLRAEMLGAKP